MKNDGLDASMKKRAAEKQASRDEDARRLAAGEVTPEELRRQNGFLSALGNDFKIVNYGGRPLRRRKKR